MPSSLARLRSWTVERRSASIARLWTMPEHPRAHRAARAVVARARAPERRNASWTTSSAAVRWPSHAVGERERGGRVAVVDDLERRARRRWRTSCIRSSSARSTHRPYLPLSDTSPAPRIGSAVEQLLGLVGDVVQRALGQLDAVARLLARALVRLRTRRTTSAVPAVAPTPTATTGRTQLRGSRIDAQLPALELLGREVGELLQRRLEALATGARAARRAPAPGAAAPRSPMTRSLSQRRSSSRRRSPRAA